MLSRLFVRADEAGGTARLSRLLTWFLGFFLAAGAAIWGHAIILEQPVFTASGARLHKQIAQAVVKGTDPSFGKEDLSPLTVSLARLAAKAASIDPARALAVVSGVAACLLAVALYLYALSILPFYLAGLAVLLFALSPVIAGGALRWPGIFISLALLMVPTAVLGAFVRCRPGVRLVVAGVAGVVAGLSVTGHHLGLWAALCGFLAIFMGDRETKLKNGLIETGAKGWESAIYLLAALAVFVVSFKLYGIKGKMLLEYLFGPWLAQLPPMTVGGEVYREAAGVSPPMWTTLRLFVVKTPPIILFGALSVCIAVVVKAFRRTTSSAAGEGRLFWFAATPFVVALTVGTLSGMPEYQPGFDVLCLMAWLPIMAFLWGIDRLARPLCANAATYPMPPHELTGAPELEAALGDSTEGRGEEALGGTSGIEAIKPARGDAQVDTRGGQVANSGQFAFLSWAPVVAISVCLLALGAQMAFVVGHYPYPGGYVSFLGGGAARFHASANDLFVEPTIDAAAVEAMQQVGGKVTVVPWGASIQPLLNHAAERLGTRRVQARAGGPGARLVVTVPSSWMFRVIDYGSSVSSPLVEGHAGALRVWRLTNYSGNR